MKQKIRVGASSRTGAAGGAAIDGGIITAAVAIVRDLNGGGRAVGYVAVDGAIAVVHGADKCAWTFLPSFALALHGSGDTVAGLLHRGSLGFLEKFLFFPALMLVRGLGRRGLRGRGLRGNWWLHQLRLRWLRRLPLLRLVLRCGLLAGFILAPAPAAPMPLRLHLTIVRNRPLFRLGQRRFCCHDACTSWS